MLLPLGACETMPEEFSSVLLEPKAVQSLVSDSMNEMVSPRTLEEVQSHIDEAKALLAKVIDDDLPPYIQRSIIEEALDRTDLAVNLMFEILYPTDDYKSTRLQVSEISSIGGGVAGFWVHEGQGIGIFDWSPSTYEFGIIAREGKTKSLDSLPTMAMNLAQLMNADSNLIVTLVDYDAKVKPESGHSGKVKTSADRLAEILTTQGIQSSRIEIIHNIGLNPVLTEDQATIFLAEPRIDILISKIKIR